MTQIVKSGEQQMQSQERRVDPAGIVVAALLAVLAGVIIWDMTTLQITQTYGVGPKAMPIVVATGLGAARRSAIWCMAFRGELSGARASRRICRSC